MREYEFRGKRIDDEWVYGFGVNIYETMGNERKAVLYTNQDEYMCIDNYEVDPKTVGQYTGLQNAYEDDVIEVESQMSGIKHLYRIQWDIENARFMSVSINGTIREMVSSTLERGGKIIGNIHDNPELLEG